MSRSYELSHYTGAGNQSREASCVAYFARFCERAKAEMVSAEGVRQSIFAEGHPQRPPRPSLVRGAPGPGIDLRATVVDGMRVTEKVVEVARRWVETETPGRKRPQGLLAQMAEEAGVSISTIKKLGRRIRDGKV
jgi:hypothetical protein